MIAYAFTPKAGDAPRHKRRFLVHKGRVFASVGTGDVEAAIAAQVNQLGVQVLTVEGHFYFDINKMDAIAKEKPHLDCQVWLTACRGLSEATAKLVDALKKLPFRLVAQATGNDLDAALVQVKAWEVVEPTQSGT